MAKLQTLKSALPVLDTRRVQTMQAGSWRTSDQTAAQRGYGYKWQKAREQFLREHPLCVMCQAQDRVEAATVVDHRTPHQGNQSLFWDRKNWQPLCVAHHNSDAQRKDNEIKRMGR
ncbi:HNH endonuclease signature motif containing protein [Delftia tsuruhatensis]|uniref:HNH endonuclease signature motif containing protein n=1 Tax=Delftia tsuruhatensis TaxID=180282 RepID=UPI00370A33DF